MKLRALHLSNVRRFTGKRASISGIGDGISVICEANEFGKSTFFDALHALFFEKFGSTAKPVKSLQPYAMGPVEIAAEVETEAGLFRIEKRFLAKKLARIVRLSDGATIAQDDEAERWIATLLGASGDGPAGLLWVRQGLVGLEPDSRADKERLTETRRDLMSSIAGEIDTMTGGRRMDRVMRQLAEDLGTIATRTGRPTGDWKAAAQAVETLAAEVAALSRQVALLDGALAERREKEALLARLEDPQAVARRALAVARAQDALATSRAHADQLAAAARDRDGAALAEKYARVDLDTLLTAMEAVTAATAGIETSRSEALSAETAVADLKQRLDVVRGAEDRARTAVAEARATLEAARQQTEARKARDVAATLTARLATATEAQGRHDAARARAKASAATPDWLARTDAAQGDVARAEAAVQAQTATLMIDYSGEVRLTLDGRALVDGQVVTLDGTAQMDLPGIGRMTITAQPLPQTALDALARARAALTALLAEGGAATAADARALAAARADASREAEMAKALLDSLVPEGTLALRATLAEAALAAKGAEDAPPPPVAALQEAVLMASAAQDQATRDLQRTQPDHAAAREGAVRLRAALDTATAALARATLAAGPAETREQRRANLLRAVAEAGAVLAVATRRHDTLAASAPDLATAEAEARRANEAASSAADQCSRIKLKLAEVSAEIRTMAGNAVEERLEDIRGRLDAARQTEARHAARAAALIRLQTALEAERSAAQDTYLGPVQEELKPLLSILHRDAALTFDGDSLLPNGLTRGLAAEALDDLSGGTREQIAILTRLAFARLFARQGRHIPIVLDDALVYSDDDRIIKMFTALTRVAEDQQIVVFSCRQLAFQDLGGARPTLRITDL